MTSWKKLLSLLFIQNAFSQADPIPMGQPHQVPVQEKSLLQRSCWHAMNLEQVQYGPCLIGMGFYTGPCANS